MRVFGPGTHRLLWHIDRSGSLNQAAKEMKMSYSKAWQVVHSAEEYLGVALLDRRTGGPTGGGSSLTEEAQVLLACFGAYVRDVDDAVGSLFAKHFGETPYAKDDDVRMAGGTGLV